MIPGAGLINGLQNWYSGISIKGFDDAINELEISYSLAANQRMPSETATRLVTASMLFNELNLAINDLDAQVSELERCKNGNIQWIQDYNSKIADPNHNIYPLTPEYQDQVIKDDIVFYEGLESQITAISDRLVNVRDNIAENITTN